MAELGNNDGSIVLSTVSNTVNLGETWTIDESAIMYMRSKTISFFAQGLKPNTIYYPFFNNVDISSCCSIYDNQISSTIKTDNLGSVKGNFYLPAATFVCGSHIFKLVDNVRSVDGNLPYIPAPQYGSTEASYEASGILKQQQKNLTTLTIIDNHSPPTIIIYPPAQIPEPLPPTPIPQPEPIPVPIPIPQPEPIPPKIIVPPIILPHMGIGCNVWRYGYTITSTNSKSNHVVSSNSSTPPNLSSINPEGTTLFEGAIISYIKTDKIFNNKWNHTYNITGPTVTSYIRNVHHISSTEPPTFFDRFIAMKPSGLKSTDVYNVIIPNGQSSPWVFVGMVPCPPVEVPVVENFPMEQAVEITSDPLAQSFYIDNNVYPSGVFVTSIAVYFMNVDQSTPVLLELRNMNNGFPHSTILPGGISILPGYSTIQSDNASIPTVFKFDNPIFLSPKTEFCFVLRTSSLGYDVWCSRFGDIDVITGKVIDEQPFGGVLFKSANNGTWTPVQYDDIKFDLNIAEFNINNTATLSLSPQNFNNSQYYNTKQTLPLSYIKTTLNSNVVIITLPMHGLIDKDSIFIGDFPSDINGINENEFENNTFIITYIDEDTISITVDSYANKSGNVLSQDLSQIINNIPPSEFITNTTTTVPFNNNDKKTLSLTPTYSTLSYPNPPKSITNSSFEIYTNIIVNEIMIDYLGTELPNTEITEKIKFVGANYLTNAHNHYISKPVIEIDKKKSYAFDEPRLIASYNNEQDYNISQYNSKVDLILSSTDKNISPCIDLNGISLVTKSYKIDNQNDEIDYIYSLENDTETNLNNVALNSEIDAGTGIASAKYKSKVVHLSSSAKRISLFVVGNAKHPSVIDAYVRLSNDESTHIDIDWKWIPLDNPKVTSNEMNYNIKFINSINDNVVNEWYYEYVSVDSFTIFDIKLVMRSTNSSIIPKIYGIRTITNIS